MIAAISIILPILATIVISGLAIYERGQRKGIEYAQKMMAHLIDQIAAEIAASRSSAQPSASGDAEGRTE